jgi:hypothetical protein
MSPRLLRNLGPKDQTIDIADWSAGGPIIAAPESAETSDTVEASPRQFAFPAVDSRTH